MEEMIISVYLKPALLKGTTALQKIGLLNILTTSSTYETRLVYPWFGYSVWLSVEKVRLTIMGDQQNAPFVEILAQKVSFLMLVSPITNRVQCLVANQTQYFLWRNFHVEKLPDLRAEALLMKKLNYWGPW